MLSAKLLPYLNQIISAKRWSDEEIKDDANYLKEQLVQIRKTLTLISFLYRQDRTKPLTERTTNTSKSSTADN